MPVLALGVSFRRAPVALLERLTFGDDDYAKAYHHLSGLEPIRESVILSTCNRVEVYAEIPRYHEGFQEMKRFLSESRDVPVEEFVEPLYSHYEDQAAEHLFSVAAGIDSMVIGEPQILSQVRAAVRRAEAEGAAGPALSALFRRAVRVGKRARLETAIGASPSAFVEAGAGLAASHLGGLEGRSLLVIGAGKMGELAIRSLQRRGIRKVRVLNRSLERAARVASRIGAEFGPLDELGKGLAEADLVVASTGSTGVVVTQEAVKGAITGGKRSLFLLDLGVPRDVDPRTREIPEVGVADIDDLRDALVDERVGVEGEVIKVRALVADETKKFATAKRAARLAPLIEALRERGEEVRAIELRRMASRLAHLSERDRETVEALTRGIVNKLLHDPVVRVKDLSGLGGDYVKALAELFDLPSPPEE
jgi:glutamyl-tRNA reductase